MNAKDFDWNLLSKYWLACSFLTMLGAGAGIAVGVSLVPPADPSQAAFIGTIANMAAAWSGGLIGASAGGAVGTAICVAYSPEGQRWGYFLALSLINAVFLAAAH